MTSGVFSGLSTCQPGVSIRKRNKLKAEGSRLKPRTQNPEPRTQNPEPIFYVKSPLSLYHQLADILMEGIRSGDYPPGSRLPSGPQLAKDYGIGRPTVRQAIDVLMRKCLLSQRCGSGTYVRTEEQETDRFSLAGTSSAFHDKTIQLACTNKCTLQCVKNKALQIIKQAISICF